MRDFTVNQIILFVYSSYELDHISDIFVIRFFDSFLFFRNHENGQNVFFGQRTKDKIQPKISLQGQSNLQCIASSPEKPGFISSSDALIECHILTRWCPTRIFALTKIRSPSLCFHFASQPPCGPGIVSANIWNFWGTAYTQMTIIQSCCIDFGS